MLLNSTLAPSLLSFSFITYGSIYDVQVPDVTMAYWDKTSHDTRQYGIPRSLTDEYVQLDEEVPS